MKQVLLLCVVSFFCLSVKAQEYTETSTAYGIVESYGTPPGFTAGGGISCVDFNQDGLDDLTFASCINNQLYFYENQGGGNFTLIDPPLVSNTDEVKGILWIDYDNDGDKDLVTAAYGGPNRLYVNTGSLNLVDSTLASGLPLDSASSTSVTAADYDHDGDLDLYICNYGFLPSFPPPPPDTNYMYRNNGDGTFTDVTAIAGTADSTRQSWCASFFDYNNDGWADLYVSNDRIDFRNALYHNNGDGTFTDVSAATGTDIHIDAMNVGIGDYDNNGYLDVYVTNTLFQPGSVFHKNNGDNTFTDVASATGTLFNGRVGWGGTLFDFDNDQDLDLYVCSSLPVFSLPNGFFINDGNGNYTEPYAASGGLQGADYKQSHCNSIGDFNNDGLWDIAVSQSGNDKFQVWENIVSNDNHWFKLLLEGTSSNRDAFGAWIEVWIDGQKYVRTTHSHQAFWAQYSNTMIIGTGVHHAIDSLVIKWPFPSGGLPYTKEVIPGAGIQMGAVNTIVEGSGCHCTSPAVHTVTSLANAGAGTLRDLMDSACACDTIRFDPSLQNDTIALSGSPLEFSKSVVIEGFPQANITLRIDEGQSAWTIPYGLQVSISGVEILDGAVAPPDPMITNEGMLTLENVIFTSRSSIAPGQSFVVSTGILTQRGVIEVQLE